MRQNLIEFNRFSRYHQPSNKIISRLHGFFMIAQTKLPHKTTSKKCKTQAQIITRASIHLFIIINNIPLFYYLPQKLDKSPSQKMNSRKTWSHFVSLTPRTIGWYYHQAGKERLENVTVLPNRTKSELPYSRRRSNTV